MTVPSSKNKNAIQRADTDKLLCFFFSKAAALAHEVNETYSNAAIHVKNEIGFLNQFSREIPIKAFK